MIAIVDYGLGNLKAFANIYSRLNVPFKYASSPDDFEDVTHIILPGVGAFDYAIKKLNASGMRDILDEAVFTKKLPVLGICVGMQIMAESSEEGAEKGLGWFDSKVVKLKKHSANLPLPHMGWNNLNILQNNKLFERLDKTKEFYFLHSYHFAADCSYTIATTTYECEMATVISKGNIHGIQCHPEKSHQNGVELLRSFCEI